MALKGVARLTDIHVCPIHGTNTITSASSSINVNGLPLARVGDTTGCGASIVTGVSNFWGQQKKTAHLGSKTSHGGTITTASPDVLVNVSSFQTVIGGVKELINTFYRQQQLFSPALPLWEPKDAPLFAIRKKSLKHLESGQKSNLNNVRG